MAGVEQIDMAKRTIRRDEKYKRLKKAYETLPAFNIPIEEFTKEISFLHSQRNLRELKLNDPSFADKAIGCTIQEQSVRSRLTEILIDCLAAQKAMDRALSTFKDYVLVEYNHILKIFGTKQERLMFLDSILRVFISYIDRVEELASKCKLIVEDIDKANYAIRNMVQAFQVIGKPELRV